MSSWLKPIIVAGVFCISNIACGEGPKDAGEHFVDQLAEGKFKEASSIFDETMSKAMPPDKLEAAWKAVQKSAGKFRKRTASRVEKVGKYDVALVTCEFANAKLDTRVVFDEDEKIAGLFFVPTKDNANYEAPKYVQGDSFKEVKLRFGEDAWKLPGTLTVPNGNGPFPAIILVHGSGPNDRDETIGPNKPFKDLAWGLASRGVTVFRYDKRTLVYGEQLGKLDSLTVKEETIDDVVAAIDMLRTRSEVDTNKIFVCGHSLGGYLVPRIAAQVQSMDNADSKTTKVIAGYILMAANARPIQELIWEQTNYILNLDGKVTDDEQTHLDQLKPLVDQINGAKLSEAASTDLLLGCPPGYWLDLRGYHPEKTASKNVSVPALLVQGERDYQVTLTDFDKWKSALKDHGNFSFKMYPTLNHLLMSGKGLSTPAEYQIAGHVDEQVIKDISDWIDSVSQ